MTEKIPEAEKYGVNLKRSDALIVLEELKEVRHEEMRLRKKLSQILQKGGIRDHESFREYAENYGNLERIREGLRKYDPLIKGDLNEVGLHQYEKLLSEIEKVEHLKDQYWDKLKDDELDKDKRSHFATQLYILDLELEEKDKEAAKILEGLHHMATDDVQPPSGKPN